jgi:hypothetical protein
MGIITKKGTDEWNRKQARREYFLATTFQLQPPVIIVKMPAWFQDKKASLMRAEGGVRPECLAKNLALSTRRRCGFACSSMVIYCQRMRLQSQFSGRDYQPLIQLTTW